MLMEIILSLRGIAITVVPLHVPNQRTSVYALYDQSRTLAIILCTIFFLHQAVMAASLGFAIPTLTFNDHCTTTGISRRVTSFGYVPRVHVII
jgi:hypothetical protein